MSNFINKIGAIKSLYQTGGCSKNDIIEAQKKLDLNFSQEYKSYILTYGAISFRGTEWTGLGKRLHGYLNVIDATLMLRDLDSSFPSDCFVVENLGTDTGVVISNSEGGIYIYHQGQKKKIHINLENYLDECLLRL